MSLPSLCCYIKLYLASRLALESLLLALKKEAAMNPQLQGECCQQPREQGSVPFLAEPPDENQALADTLTAALGDPEAENQAKAISGSDPRG